MLDTHKPTQKELKSLPKITRRGWDSDDEEFYGPKSEIVWGVCEGSNRGAKPFVGNNKRFSCAGCSWELKADQMVVLDEPWDKYSKDDGTNKQKRPPRHLVPTTIQQQAEDRIRAMAAACGYDRNDEVTWAAVSAVANAARGRWTGGRDELTVFGMNVLSMSLMRRSAAGEAARAFAELADLDISDEASPDPGFWESADAEAPFFTEAFLYGAVGKGAARTILHHVRKVRDALGASGNR